MNVIWTHFVKFTLDYSRKIESDTPDYSGLKMSKKQV